MLEGRDSNPRDLYALRDAGVLTTVSRGVYRLSDLPPLREPDLATVAARVPKAVVCLISALHFHGLTPEIPHVVSIALLRGTATPKLAWPPVTVYRFSRPMFEAGIRDSTNATVGCCASTARPRPSPIASSSATGWASTWRWRPFALGAERAQGQAGGEP